MVNRSIRWMADGGSVGDGAAVGDGQGGSAPMPGHTGAHRAGRHRSFPYLPDCQLLGASSRNQGSRGKVARMIKIIFDIKRRYLPTHSTLGGV
jgi:hypothetical protein